MNYLVGQKVWWQPNGRFSGKELAVTKVGRKWVALSNGDRFDPSTGAVDGGNYSSPGSVWASRVEYQRAVLRERAWQHFQKTIWNHRLANSVTVEDVLEAARLLGLKLIGEP